MFSENEVTTLVTLLRVSGTLSLVGSVAVVADMLRRWSQIRKSPSRIVLWWALAHLIYLPWILVGDLFIQHPLNSKQTFHDHIHSHIQPNTEHGAQDEAHVSSKLCITQSIFLQFGLLASVSLLLCHRVLMAFPIEHWNSDASWTDH
jgi:hypothetical protein